MATSLIPFLVESSHSCSPIFFYTPLSPSKLLASCATLRLHSCSAYGLIPFAHDPSSPSVGFLAEYNSRKVNTLNIPKIWNMSKTRRHFKALEPALFVFNLTKGRITMRVLTLILIVFSPMVAVGQSIIPVVAIGAIDTAAQNISCKGWDRSRYNCNQDLAEGFRIMLETALTKTGKMDVMERGRMDTVLAEQGLASAGFTDSGGDVGGLTGVDYMVYGTITRFGAQESGVKVASSGAFGRKIPGGGLDTSRKSVNMGVDLKVTNVSTGKIMIADEVSGTVQTGSSFAVGGISKTESSADPFADVQRVVAGRIAEAIVTTRTPVKVIGIQSDGTLVLNYGNVFFRPGDQLAAYSIGEEFIDPDTGEVLGADETKVGAVSIVSTTARLSKASITEGDPIVFVEGTVLKRLLVPSGQAGQTRKARKRSGAAW